MFVVCRQKKRQNALFVVLPLLVKACFFCNMFVAQSRATLCLYSAKLAGTYTR